MKFNIDLLSPADQITARQLIGHGPWKVRDPDLTIAPDGKPYIYRWHIIPRAGMANLYFHVQTASDPERPLHDHPWDNMSVILSGFYEEIISEQPNMPTEENTRTVLRVTGETVFRKAEWSHRLILPKGMPYTMTLFSTGPKRREWGFWYPDGWRSYKEVTEVRNGVSVHTAMVLPQTGSFQ